MSTKMMGVLTAIVCLSGCVSVNDNYNQRRAGNADLTFQGSAKYAGRFNDKGAAVTQSLMSAL